jgi:DNA mismatch endonuclease, patch repair protein
MAGVGVKMSDNHTPQVRYYNMSRIKSVNTKPEKIVRKYLFSRGLRYRKNDKRYARKPDIVMPKYNTVIITNSCLCHCHEGCSGFVMCVLHNSGTQLGKKVLPNTMGQKN